jgi:hypothetical protein
VHSFRWIRRCGGAGKIAELSTTEAIAARASCLLCRGLFSGGPAVFIHDDDFFMNSNHAVRPTSENGKEN